MSAVAKRVRYVVIGGLPEPSGGVTVFNGDLVDMLLQRGHEVIVFDQNRGTKLARFATADVRVWARGPGWRFHLWVSAKLLWLGADRILLHTSTTSGLLRLIAPIARGIPCGVFLHNGQVEATGTSEPVRSVLRWLLARVDYIFIMSASQQSQLFEKVYPMDRVSRIVPIIRQKTGADRAPKLLVERPMVIVACGHETRIYNYEFAVRLSQELPDAELHLYLYGTHIDQGYLDEMKALDTGGKLRVIRNKDRETFRARLSNARLFVRPNHVDSFGVSVVDALQMATPVVASDVCERAAGALLFAAGDYGAFRAACLQALAQNNLPAMDRTAIDATRRQIEAMIDEDEARVV